MDTSFPLIFRISFSVLGRDVGTVGMVGLAVSGAQGAAMLATIVVVERALKKTFDQDGKRKTEMD